MEFLAGVITTIICGLIINAASQKYEKRKARKAYIPPSGPRPNANDDR